MQWKCKLKLGFFYNFQPTVNNIKLNVINALTDEIFGNMMQTKIILVIHGKILLNLFIQILATNYTVYDSNL